MNAVISGASGMALLVDAGSFHSFHLKSPDTRRLRQPEEYALLFGGDPSVEFLENVTEEEVLSRLRDAVEREHATRFMLLLLDGAWPTDVRVEAAKKLEDMLDTDKQQRIKDLLFSLPLPPGESVQSALLLCRGPRVKALLAELVMSQEAIAETRAAWDAAVMQSPASEPDLLHARALAVRSGLFREMVAFTLQRARFDEVRVHVRATDFKEIPGWDALLNSWAAPMHSRWQVAGEIIAATWGHLRHLHLPRPRNPLPGMAPAMQWPRAESAAHGPDAMDDAAVAGMRRVRRPRDFPHWISLLGIGFLLFLYMLRQVAPFAVDAQQLAQLVGYLAIAFLMLQGMGFSGAAWYVPQYVPTGDVQADHDKASVSQALRAQVDALNATIDATADEARRIRRWRNVPYWLYLVLAVGSLLAWYVLPNVIAFAVELQWFLIQVTVLAAAIVVFQLLNHAFGASRESLRRAFAQSIGAQADREEASLALAVALSPAGPAREASAGGAGWLHVRIPEIDAFADRSVDIVVDGKAQRHEGTNSVVLRLATGSHALEFAGRSNAGHEVRKKKLFVADSGTVREATLRMSAGGPGQADDIVLSM
ncbi:hypothetical protein [Pseudoduganella albidiflava]|uniref:HEAT repeat domain-containing protein n=1 Tax=Pseudoduganella albidiflava TaxID=321983 RepID=A0A411X0A5_9BURK|nr:hypothetical protein [Pseudoduganella albidiflava]QBI02390.1 hypothetical protein EYF70_17240 [Pseudoduganella albidiflava]GGY43197.1 hypothetical protein GCM10007387_26570 [Pseudoduganella albidiflava]